MITRYKAADPLDPTSQAEYKMLAAGAQRYWHGTRAAFEQVKNDIPNNTMICITDDNDAPSDNAPIGSVFDYEGNTAPDGYLFCDGSQFDTSLYPDLYLFLGSDTLPNEGSEYDLSNPESITVAQLNAGYTAQHSGWFIFSGYNTSLNENNNYISVNGVNIAGLNRLAADTGCIGYIQIQVKKGDVIKSVANTITLWPTGTCFIAPYAKPKIIKATSNMSKSDASALLAQLLTVTAVPITPSSYGSFSDANVRVNNSIATISGIFNVSANIPTGSFVTIGTISDTSIVPREVGFNLSFADKVIPGIIQTNGAIQIYMNTAGASGNIYRGAIVWSTK